MSKSWGFFPPPPRKILIDRRISHYEMNNILSDSQNGFRSNRSCLDHIFSMYSILNRSIHAGGEMFVCLIDFRKCFDYLDRNLLLLKLARDGLQGKMYWAIKSVYNNTSACVKLIMLAYSLTCLLYTSDAADD